MQLTRGEQIAVERKRQGLSQRELAEALTEAGVPADQSAVSDMERGKHERLLGKAAALLGISREES